MAKKEKLPVPNVSPEMKDQAVEICKIEATMRKKVEELIPQFEEMPAAQLVTSTQGEPVWKPNPAIQEIRALFLDYCKVVKMRQDILAIKTAPAEVASITAFREKLRIAK